MPRSLRIVAPIALMALIFVLSAQPNLGTGLGVWDTILRKLAHMAEYGALWWLWWWAFGRRWAIAAAVIAIAYAASDEIHQHFVSGRHGTWTDVLIDGAGVAIAMLITRRGTRRAAAPRPRDPSPRRS